MAVAYKLDDGLHELQLPDGSTVKTALSPERLEDIGYEIQDKPTDPGPRIAENDESWRYNPFDPRNANQPVGGINWGNKKETATDAPKVGFKDLFGGDKPLFKNPLEKSPEQKAREAKEEADRAAHGGNDETPAPTAEAAPTPSNDNAAPAAAPAGPLFPSPSFHKIKGGDKRVAFTRTPALPGAEDAKEALADASIDLKAAAQQHADNETAGLNAQSAQAGREARQAQNEYDTYAARKAAHEAEYRQKQAAIDKERQDVENLKIDPKRWWANQSTGGKIMAAISMMAGGILQGMGRTKNNPGYDMIRQAIQDDIEEQKARRQMRLEGLHTRQTELDRLIDMYGSPALAEKELYNRQQAAAAAMARKLAIDTKVPEVQANLQEYLAQADKERALQNLSIDQQFGEHTAEQWQNIPDRYYQVGGVQETPEERKRRVTVDGRPGWVTNEAGQQDVQKKLTGMGFINGRLSELEKRYRELSPGDTEGMRKIGAEITNLVNDMSLAQEQGITRKEDFEMANDKLGHPQDWLGNKSTALDRLGQTRSYFQARREQVVRDNVFSDPKATTPFLTQPSSNRRPF